MPIVETAAAAPRGARPLRRVEYERLVCDGAFEGERIELVGGVLLHMSPQDAEHADATHVAARSFRRQLGVDWEVREEKPLALGLVSEPEPDIAVVPAGRYRSGHPTSAVLVVEVARTSLRYDLGVKAADYLAADVREYWVLDLLERIVHVHRRTAGRWTVEPSAHGTVYSLGDPALALDLDELFAV